MFSWNCKSVGLSALAIWGSARLAKKKQAPDLKKIEEDAREKVLS
jgi:hypothetical protein